MSSSSPNIRMTNITAHSVHAPRHSSVDMPPRAKLIKLMQKIFLEYFSGFVFTPARSDPARKLPLVMKSELKWLIWKTWWSRTFRIECFLLCSNRKTWLLYSLRWALLKWNAQSHGACEPEECCDTTQLALLFRRWRPKHFSVLFSRNLFRIRTWCDNTFYNIVIFVNYIGNLFPINFAEKVIIDWNEVNFCHIPRKLIKPNDIVQRIASTSMEKNTEYKLSASWHSAHNTFPTNQPPSLHWFSVVLVRTTPNFQYTNTMYANTSRKCN